jgi:hypothetical protein
MPADDLQLDLPTITSAQDCVDAAGVVLEALGDGRIDSESAARAVTIVEVARRTLETSLLEQRVEAVERQLSIGAGR